MIEPDKPFLLFERANLEEAKGNNEKALDYFKDFIKKYPDDYEGYKKCISLLKKMEKLKEAKELSTVFIEKFPRSTMALYYRGLISYRLEQYKEAKIDLEKIVGLDNKFDCYSLLSYVDLCSKNWSETITDTNKYEKIFGFEDKSQAVHITALVRWYAQKKMGNYEEAASVLKTAREKLPRVWPYPIVEFLSGNISNTELLKQAKSNDDETEARTWLGASLLLEGRKSEAREQLNWVIEKGNQSFYEIPLAKSMLKEI